MNPSDAAAARTSQKLRFARIIIDELGTHPSRNSGSDLERSHHEAFLFHLYGAVDAFLHEINAHFSCGLAPEQITRARLQATLRGRAQLCPELDEIIALASESESFLGSVKDIRHFATHRGGLPMAHYSNGPRNLVHPITREEFVVDTLALFTEWLLSTTALLERLRANLITRAA